MTREDLNGQAIEIKEHPARILTTERQGKILVEYGDSVVWSFGVEECQTWFVSQYFLLAPTTPNSGDTSNATIISYLPGRHFNKGFNIGVSIQVPDLLAFYT